MSTPLADYKAFIDGLVNIRKGVIAARVLKNEFPDTPENQPIAALCSRLTEEERGTIAKLVEQARSGGVHDALVFLHDRIMIDEYRLTVGGRELPVEPFDTQLYYDWMGRAMGDKWPDEENHGA
jgi:predicted alpha-1,6-mannanase (GH76 family)